MFGLTYFVLGMVIKLNILIFGATGFIGSKLANTLRSRGDCVYVLSRCTTDSVWVINEFDSARGNICQLSLGDNFRFECSNNLKMLNLDYFLHGACGLVPSSNQQDFFKEYVSLLDPTFTLIDSCNDLGIPIIYLSSAGAIYSDSEFPLAETSDLNPSTFYGFSKYIIEQHIKKKHYEGLNYMILRPTNVYGRDLDNVNRAQGLIENSILSIMRSMPIKQFGSDSKIRDYLFVDDFVEVTTYLLDEPALNQTLNIGSGHLVEVNKVIETIYEILKKEPNILITEERSFDKSIVDVDVSKIRKLIPFKPMGIHEGLKKYLSQLGLIHLEVEE